MSMNPPEVPMPDGIEKIDVRLYSVTGWFSQTQKGIDSMAWGGYFRYGVEDQLVVDGQLVDAYGASRIEGRMTDDSLEFVKQYERFGSLPINYSFRREGNIWVGSYEVSGKEPGRAECVTTIVLDDAFNVLCGAPVVEFSREYEEPSTEDFPESEADRFNGSGQDIRDLF